MKQGVEQRKKKYEIGSRTEKRNMKQGVEQKKKYEIGSGTEKRNMKQGLEQKKEK